MRIKPKKSLAQNFLIDQNIQRKIILAAELKPQDIVLEIGAGRGELTRFIIEKVDKVYAVEISPELCQLLRAQFKAHKNINIIEQDILKFNLRRSFTKIKTRIKVIGNIPYYITTPIIEYLLEFRDRIDSVFLTVQKEFAKRIVAQPGSKDYGSFSCFIQYYTKPKLIFLIKKTCFFPTPKVDSYFLRLDIKRELLLEPEIEKLFFKIIRTAFNQRRKTIRNSLRGVIAQELLGIFFNKYDISPNARPEDLGCEDFANLTKILTPPLDK